MCYRAADPMLVGLVLTVLGARSRRRSPCSGTHRELLGSRPGTQTLPQSATTGSPDMALSMICSCGHSAQTARDRPARWSAPRPAHARSPQWTVKGQQALSGVHGVVRVRRVRLTGNRESLIESSLTNPEC